VEKPDLSNLTTGALRCAQCCRGKKRTIKIKKKTITVTASIYEKGAVLLERILRSVCNQSDVVECPVYQLQRRVQVWPRVRVANLCTACPAIRYRAVVCIAVKTKINLLSNKKHLKNVGPIRQSPL